MKELKYKKIDAFTSDKSLGNPAACLYIENNILTDAEMLLIGKQHKGFVSEVVFAEKSKTADIKLTYYSSECEVDFCGHGTIATMYDFIKNNSLLADKPLITFETNKKGILSVLNKLHDEDTIYITAPSPIYINTDLSANKIADALCITNTAISDKNEIEIIDGGLRTLLVPITSLQEEINMFPDEQKLKQFCLKTNIDIILVYSFETSHKDSFVHTRVFAPKFGYLEDPATGSGNSALGYYMIKHNLWDGKSISIEQGGINQLYNTVKLMYDNDKILFGGSAKTRIDGKYFID